jgi:hypothetical protein
MSVKWTKDELKTLRKLYANNSCATVAAAVDKSAVAVRKQANRLGLAKSRKYRREVLHRTT